MAKLSNINIPDVANKKAKNTIPTVHVPGDAVTRYNEARALVDKGTETMNELKPILLKTGLEAVFTHNSANAADPKALISSVNLMDGVPDEDTATAETLADALKEVCMFTWTKKDTACDAKQVDEEFKRIVTLEGRKANINNYVAYEVVASFDTSVFKVDGKFNQERYDAYIEALKDVSEKFGVDMPLSCGKVLKPKPDFHERRWRVFDVETNLQLQAVLPTQCNLKPVKSEKTE